MTVNVFYQICMRVIVLLILHLSHFTLSQTTNPTCKVSSYQPYAAHNGSCDCTQALDNDTTTFWLTKYYPTPDLLPHDYTIDMQTPSNITTLSYLPRQDASLIGNIIDWKISLSTDRQDWQRFFGTWAPDFSLKRFDFGEQVEARWIILTAYTSAGNPGNRTNAAKIRVSHDTDGPAAETTRSSDPATTAASPNGGRGNTKDANPLGDVGTAFTVLGGLAALGTLGWSVVVVLAKWRRRKAQPSMLRE
ncbi:MAG: hypothetical protein Q9220_000766 [cf. Caloplaca sp. 1 TL-2023]